MSDQITSGEVKYSSGSIKNRIIIYKNKVANCPLVFVPGWCSTISTWRFVIPRLQEISTVYYFETREKPYTKRPDNEEINLDIDVMGKDITNFINDQLSGNYILIGASIGASCIINSFKNLINKPKALVLLTPNNRIKLPSIFPIVRLCPLKLLRFIRPIALKIVKMFAYGKDGHRIEGAINALSIAEFDIMLKSAKDLNRMDLTNVDTSIIDTPTLIIAASEDGVHSPKDSIYYHDYLYNSEYKTFKSFTEVHSSKCAKAISNWLNTL